MTLFSAAVYWIIAALWLTALVAIAWNCTCRPRKFDRDRLLLVAVVSGLFLSLLQDSYFLGAQFGILPNSLASFGDLHLLVLVKIVTVVLGAVLSVLLLEWPAALRERQLSGKALRLATEALDQEVEENRRMFESSADLILVADRSRVIRRASQSSREILGYEPHELEGRYGGEFVAPPDLENFHENIRKLAMSRQTFGTFQLNFTRKDGRLITLAISGVWSKEVERYFVVVRDTTERKAAEQALIRLAHFDQLTGLLNRTSLRRDLDELAASKAAGSPRYSVLLFDLDSFKGINDTMGHSSGDAVLQQVAERLQSVTSQFGKTYRMGGDEFLIVIADCQDPLRLGGIADCVLQAINSGVELDGKRLDLGASAGIAMATLEHMKPDDLLADADLALYDAKAAGGRCYRVFQASMRAKAAARQDLDQELRRACINREFVLHYQPQLRLSDGAVVGAEALLRWQHPQRGLLYPTAFIEALAANPCAIEVGDWILRTACEAAASWRQKGLPPIRIGVNLFPAQFHNVMLLQDVENALQQSGLPASALELEITENIALNDDKAMLASLRALRGIGVGLAFDDFGTGYASLSFLTRFPLTRLKVDRSFVHRMHDSAGATDRAIVRAIILMAHNLGLEVIAEGVENERQALLLRNKRCNEAQGFLFSPALPSPQFEAYLRAAATDRTLRVSRKALAS